MNNYMYMLINKEDYKIFESVKTVSIDKTEIEETKGKVIEDILTQCRFQVYQELALASYNITQFSEHFLLISEE